MSDLRALWFANESTQGKVSIIIKTYDPFYRVQEEPTLSIDMTRKLWCLTGGGVATLYDIGAGPDPESYSPRGQAVLVFDQTDEDQVAHAADVIRDINHSALRGLALRSK